MQKLTAGKGANATFAISARLNARHQVFVGQPGAMSAHNGHGALGGGCVRQNAPRRCLHRGRAQEEEAEGFRTADEGWVPARRRRRDWKIGPGADLSPAEAVQMQLQVCPLYVS